jgi:NCS1 family nucleobase:cation symporter-1
MEGEVTITSSAEIQHEDGRISMCPSASDRLQASPLYNHDLAPMAIERRTWTAYNYGALWFGMSACIPTYMLASGLLASGMNWWQALFTVFLGNTIVLLPIIANAHPGTKYGIPFPVLARAAYGTAGSNLPALMRALVACGWFGIQTWIGGQAVYIASVALWPQLRQGPLFGDHYFIEWSSFALFWLFNIVVVFYGHGLERVRKLADIAGPFVMIMTACLLAWAVWRAHGFGAIFNAPGKFNTLSEFLPIFQISLTAMIGFWGTLALNVPDFTRCASSQRAQVIGQVFALPSAMTIFAAMGVIITSAAVVIYPRASINELWDPTKLISHFESTWMIVPAMLTVAVATLCVNVAANVVSPANDFANAMPRLISFKRGALLTGLIGIAMCPWLLLASPSGYIFHWLVGYSAGLGSIAGVLIADYWIIRKQKLSLLDLYLPDGQYGGWNWRAVIATIFGCMLAWSGLIFPVMKPFYDSGWAVAFFAAALMFTTLTFVAASGKAHQNASNRIANKKDSD